jgi:predicted nucleotidyltransferase
MNVAELPIAIDREKIAAFCRKWRVRELSLFGSVLTNDFRPDSDVDVLVVCDQGSSWTLWDHLHAEEELQELVQQKVDLVLRSALRNPFRRHHILSNREILYAT